MDEAVGATSLTAAVGGIAINLTGATAGVSGQVDGTAISFNGTSNFGATATSIDLTSYNKIVVEALFNSNAYTNSDKIAWELSTTINSQTTGFAFVSDALNQTNKSNLILRGDSGYNFAYFTKPSASNWHHIVAIYDKGALTNEVQFYIDGELQTALSRFVTNNTNNFGNFIFYLMSRGGTTLFSGGKIQHLAIYSDLTDSQILAHAQATGVIDFPAGILSQIFHTSTTSTLSWTDASGGTAPITSQLQRSSIGAETWSNISGATASPFTDTVAPFTGYDYRVAYTDGSLHTVYSNTVNTTYYTVQQSDLWDNGYDNVLAPRQSTFARFVFTTDAASITLEGITSIYNNYSSWAQLGVRVDGVDQSPLEFTTNSTATFNVSLGVAGTTRTVEIISGLQSNPSGTVLGTFINKITYPVNASFSVQSPTVGNRILVYGDSIAVGGNATNPESQSYASLLRNTYNHRVMLEGWGYRSLYDDVNTVNLRSAFVSRISGYNPAVVWLAIGTNDYGLNKWNAVNFGTAYASTLDDLHTALPSAIIVCQTPIVRGNETANTFGNTTGDYRSQIISVCNARSWTTLVDGTAILTTSDLADGVHPSTAGHAKYALAVNNLLNITPTTSATATAGGSGYTFNNWTTSSTVSVSLICNANGGIGCFITKYCIDTTNSCNPSSGSTYSSTTPISTEGTSYIRYLSKDTLGILESVNSNTIKIDTTNPTINVGADQSENVEFTKTATVSDDSSGIDILTYQWAKVSGPGIVTFGDSTALSTTISVDTDGTYVISFTALDNVGNSNSDNFTLVWNTSNKRTGTTLAFRTNFLAQQRALSHSSIVYIFTFTKNLKYRQTNNEVKELQKYLNSKGYTVSNTGAGSLNNETNYFGLKTKQAVMKFQKANNLKQDGIVGPKTIEKLK